jgi:hypothetical protein
VAVLTVEPIVRRLDDIHANLLKDFQLRDLAHQGSHTATDPPRKSNYLHGKGDIKAEGLVLPDLKGENGEASTPREGRGGKLIGVL